MGRVKICPNCGHENALRELTCINCRFSLVAVEFRESGRGEEAPVAIPAETPPLPIPQMEVLSKKVKVCPSCERDNDEFATFCVGCKLNLMHVQATSRSTELVNEPVAVSATVCPASSGHIARLECTTCSGFIRKVHPGQTAGRQGEVDLSPLPGSGYISRRHARFDIDDKGRWMLVNLTDTTYTYVNSKKIQPEEQRVIEDGDHIVLGNTEFIFRTR